MNDDAQLQDSNDPLIEYLTFTLGNEIYGIDPENLERLKSLPLSEDSARFMRPIQWSGIMAMSKRK